MYRLPRINAVLMLARFNCRSATTGTTPAPSARVISPIMMAARRAQSRFYLNPRPARLHEGRRRFDRSSLVEVSRD